MDAGGFWPLVATEATSKPQSVPHMRVLVCICNNVRH